MQPEPASAGHQPPLRVLDVLNHVGATSERFLSRKIAEVARQGVEVAVLELRPSARRSHSDVHRIRGGKMGYVLAVGKLAIAQPGALLRIVVRAARARKTPSGSGAAIARAALLVVARAQVVHFAYSGIGVTFLDALGLLPELPAVVSCRGSAELIRPVVDPGRVEELKTLFARADAIHCVSAAMAEHVRQLGADPEKTHVIRPAVDVERLRSTDRRSSPRRVIVSVGRLSWEKGLDNGIAAIGTLRDRGFDVVYRIVGAGPDEDRLRFLVERSGLATTVEFLGAQSEANVIEIVAGADVFLLPSVSEGISNSTLEAMAVGTPVVATSVGGMPEIVKHETTGLLVEPWEPRQLADAVQRILDHADLAERITTAASRSVAEHHSLEQQGAAFIAMYDQVLGRTSAAPARA